MKYDRYGNVIEDRDAPMSEDWKFLAQQAMTAHRKAHGRAKKGEKQTNDCGNAECAAAMDAISRASTNGMGN